MFDEHIILSESGVQQGDPLGPALFCLTINELVKSLSSEFNCWYLDDGSIGDKPSVVINDLQNIIEKSKSLGLNLNFEKCELYFLEEVDEKILSKFNSYCPGLKIFNKDRWCLLGCPISDNGFLPFLNKKMESLNLLVSRLTMLPSHISYFILKNCLAIPKFFYLLRCFPSWHFLSALQNVDNFIRCSLEKICNILIDGEAWTQASLPICLGGIGIRSVCSLSLPCYLSSFSCVKPLIENILPACFKFYPPEFFDEGKRQWHCKTNLYLKDSDEVYQKSWDRPLLDLTVQTLFDSADSLHKKARLNAVCSVDSGAWLNALPAASFGTLLDNESFRIAIGLRLGSSICIKHDCTCGAIVCEKGLHCLSCRFNLGRLSRHQAINDLIKKALISAEIPAILEPKGTFRDDGKRPDGMTMIPWKHGRHAVWDFTCVDTMAPSHLKSSSESSGSAALSAENMKNKKYSYLQENHIFYPVGIETFGVWGSSAIHFVKEIGKRLTLVNRDKRSTSFLLQRISVAIQKGNAISILGSNLNFCK